MIQFEHIWALHGLWAIPVFILLHWMYLRWKRKSIRAWGMTEIIVSQMPLKSRRIPLLKFILLIISWALLVIAIANPRQGSKLETSQRKGIDIIVALDISNSMLAEDVSPNRLERTKQNLIRFTGKLSGDRIGLVVFAGKAVRVLPITADYAAANMIISGVNTAMIPTQGTAVGAAIEAAAQGFSEDKRRNKVIVVVSDGENHEDDAQAAAEEAFKQGILIYSIGIGTPAGSPIPKVAGKSGDFLKDSEGTTVITKLNEVMLQKIAGIGGGAYFSGLLPYSGFNALWDELEKIEKTEIETKVFSDYESIYQYPLALALFLLMIEIMMGNRKISTPKWLTQLLNISKSNR